RSSAQLPMRIPNGHVCRPAEDRSRNPSNGQRAERLNEPASGGRDARNTRTELDEFPNTSDAHGFVAAQSFTDICAGREREPDCHGVLERLRSSLPGMRQNRMSGIAQQSDATRAPCWKRVTLEQWVVAHVVRLCRGNHRSERRIEVR